ncbi:MAG: type I secretion system permease/ATPase [Ramlibacter sp.]|nr:type I secretion system permease/ATPase [Ramlibacter sp.]
MSPSKPASELREAVTALRPWFVRAAWFSLFSSLLVLAPAGYMLEIYDRVVNSRSHMTLAMLTFIVLAAFVLMEVLEWARGEIMHEASLALEKRLGARVFEAVFRAHLRHLPGGSAQPMNDLRTVREFLYSPALLALMELPVALICLVLLFAISPVLGGSAVVGALAQAGIGWLNERGTGRPLMAANRTAIAAQQYADASLRNAQVIEAMGMLRDIHARWMKRQREFLGLQTLASHRAGVYQSISRLLQIVMGSLLLGLGAWLILHGQFHGGSAMMVVGSILGGRMLAPLVLVVAQWRSVVGLRAAWERLDALLASVPPAPEAMPLPPPRGALRVEHLTASAPGSQAAILKGIAFALQPGEILVVVGPSAAGKTTLARLLVGLWPAAAGKVRLDGADVHTWDKAELGPHLGYLPQGVELIDGTLAENIARFGAIDIAKVEAAAKAVGLHEYILGLPQGYDSPVGREGAILSGGQRQRVALARALYGHPVFVVLDEPNSSLDEAGDAALAAALKALKARGTTSVVMTHRTAVLAVADKLLVLRDGTAQAFGPPDEVLATLKKNREQARAQPLQVPLRIGHPGRAAPAA